MTTAARRHAAGNHAAATVHVNYSSTGASCRASAGQRAAFSKFVAAAVTCMRGAVLSCCGAHAALLPATAPSLELCRRGSCASTSVSAARCCRRLLWPLAAELDAPPADSGRSLSNAVNRRFWPFRCMLSSCSRNDTPCDAKQAGWLVPFVCASRQAEQATHCRTCRWQGKFNTGQKGAHRRVGSQPSQSARTGTQIARLWLWRSSA